MLLKPLMVTRRNTNLKDALISSKLKDSKHPAVSGKEIQNYWEPCHIEKCNICNSIYKGTISNKHSKTETKTLHNVDCDTTNVIYLLECSICKTRYIGETKRAFKHRLKEHLADIKYNRERPVSTHINKHAKQKGIIIPSIIEIINLNPNLQSTTELRRKWELYWIYKLKTLIPFGLNTFS